MIVRIKTRGEAMTLSISVTTQGEQDIRLIVRDANQPDTVLTNRIMTINGKFDFKVRLPLSRRFVEIVIVNDADGSDSSFKYDGTVKLPLVTRLNVIDFSNNFKLNNFIRFAQKFCYNAGILDVNNPNDNNSTYHSGNLLNYGPFFIKYLDVIVDYETGEELTTPARISGDNGLIEVSKRYFIDYTVPMRLATLLHEYSHFYANEDPDNESEADINGLIIYLGLGYPRIEAGEAWCDIFMDYPTEQNMERIAIIQKFIDDFDNNPTIFIKK